MIPIYLPIAELSVNFAVILLIGGIVGMLAGMFGIGGGFLMTPLLILVGIPAAIAASSQAPQIIAASLCGVMAHWRRREVDVKLAGILMISGLAGIIAGIKIFAWLRHMGQIDLVLQLAYVLLLGSVGGIMLKESLTAPTLESSTPPRWLLHLPLRLYFPRSDRHISIFPLLLLGFIVGVLSSILGIGGGFILIPAMIYLLRLPTRFAVGTCLLQVMIMAGCTTLLHATTNHTVDAVLATILILGGAIGAQFGIRLGQKLPAERLRLGLACLILGIGLVMMMQLIMKPRDVFSVARVL